MQAIHLVLIVLIVVGIAGGAIYYYTSQTGSSEGKTSTTTTTTSESSGFGKTTSSTTTTSTTGGIDISGAWYGTYTTSQGLTGRWAFRVWKTNTGSYKGLLVTTEPYSTGDKPVMITIVLDGNRITFGGVSVGATFKGTVSGDSMSGTWKLVNNMDSGTWKGQRGVTDITPELPETNTGSTISGTTTTTTSTSGDHLLGMEPYDTILLDVKKALAKTYGSAVISASVYQQSTVVSYVNLGREFTGSSDEINSVKTELTGKGYIILGSYSGPNTVLLRISKSFDNINYTISIGFRMGGNIVQVQIE